MPEMLPQATIGQITGLVEIVNDHPGPTPIAKIAAEFDLDIQELLPSVEGAALMGFVKVDNAVVSLTDAGKRLLKATLRQRKAVLREQLLQTPIVRDVIAKLQKADGRMSKRDLADILGFKLWTHDQDLALRTLVNWGRHAQLLTYDADSQEISLIPNK